MLSTTKFGSGKLTRYKTISFFKLYFYYPFIKRMKTIRPLNFMPYNKRDALKELIEKTGHKAYETKARGINYSPSSSKITGFLLNSVLTRGELICPA